MKDRAFLQEDGDMVMVAIGNKVLVTCEGITAEEPEVSVDAIIRILGSCLSTKS